MLKSFLATRCETAKIGAGVIIAIIAIALAACIPLSELPIDGPSQSLSERAAGKTEIKTGNIVTRYGTVPYVIYHDAHIASKYHVELLTEAVLFNTAMMGALPPIDSINVIVEDRWGLPHGAMQGMELNHEIIQATGSAGRKQARNGEWNYLKIGATAALRDLYVHEVAHYWWRIYHEEGNWLSEWGAIAAEEMSKPVIGQPRPEKPSCDWNYGQDHRLLKEGTCIREAGLHAFRTLYWETAAEITDREQVANLSKNVYRAIWKMAMKDPTTTPEDLGQIASQTLAGYVSDERRQNVREAYSRRR